jgi:hypothetical protein
MQSSKNLKYAKLVKHTKRSQVKPMQSVQELNDLYNKPIKSGIKVTLKSDKSIVKSSINKNNALNQLAVKSVKFKEYEDQLTKAVKQSYLTHTLGNLQHSMESLSAIYGLNTARMMLSSRYIEDALSIDFKAFNPVNSYLNTISEIIIYAPLMPQIVLYLNSLFNENVYPNLRLKIIDPLNTTNDFYKENIQIPFEFVLGSLADQNVRDILSQDIYSLFLLGLNISNEPILDLLYSTALISLNQVKDIKVLYFTKRKLAEFTNYNQLVKGLSTHQFNRLVSQIYNDNISYNDSNILYNKLINANKQISGSGLVDDTDITVSYDNTMKSVTLVDLNQTGNLPQDLNALSNAIDPDSEQYGSVLIKTSFTDPKTKQTITRYSVPVGPLSIDLIDTLKSDQNYILYKYSKGFNLSPYQLLSTNENSMTLKSYNSSKSVAVPIAAPPKGGYYVAYGFSNTPNMRFDKFTYQLKADNTAPKVNEKEIPIKVETPEQVLANDQNKLDLITSKFGQLSQDSIDALLQLDLNELRNISVSDIKTALNQQGVKVLDSDPFNLSDPIHGDSVSVAYQHNADIQVNPRINDILNEFTENIKSINLITQINNNKGQLYTYAYLVEL